MGRYDALADVLAEHLRSSLEAAQEQHLDVVVVKARVSWVKLRIGDGAQSPSHFSRGVLWA